MQTLQRNRFKVKLFQIALRIANSLASLPNEILPPPFRIIQMGSAYWQSRALYTATELGVADALGDDIKSTKEIAQSLSLNEDHLYRLLRMLASQGIFDEHKERCFRNNKFSNCLRENHQQSVRAMVLMHNSPEISRPWFESLAPAIRSGNIPFELSHGEALFDYMNHHPNFEALFTQAMETVEGLIGTQYLEDFAWSQFERLIDVGGANGSKAIAILKQNPNIHALIFDRPSVIADAENYWQEKVSNTTLERVEFTAGDMLETIPSAQSDKDLYLFAAIFHGMGDSEAQQILANLKSACGDYSPTIVIADTIAQSQDIDPTIANFDMQMLMATRGRERTLSEWQALITPMGFSISEIVELRTFAKLLVIKTTSQK